MHSFAFTLSGKVCVPMKILMHQFLDVMSAVNVISRFLIQTWQTFTLFLANMQFLYRQDIFYILLSLHKILKCIQGLFGWFILYAIFMHSWWGCSFGHARSGNIGFTAICMYLVCTMGNDDQLGFGVTEQYFKFVCNYLHAIYCQFCMMVLSTVFCEV